MIEFDDLDDALKQINILKNLYWGIRIVDPESKEVLLSLMPKSQNDKNSLCYQVWEEGQICENCISARALNNDNTFIKFVSQEKEIFQVTVVPISVCKKKMVMEFIQDVTKKLYIENGKIFGELKKAMLSISERIDNLVIRDGMTNLFNRRFIDERLPAELTNACDFDIPLSVIFIDIDYFKNINDTYGHLAGDQVICGVAQIISNDTRRKDGWAARYGGDEFLVCFSGVDNRTAIKIAERIRSSVQKEVFRIGEELITVTCSFGVKTVSGKDCKQSASDLIDQADRNLYKAKCAGRNKVV